MLKLLTKLSASIIFFILLTNSAHSSLVNFNATGTVLTGPGFGLNSGESFSAIGVFDDLGGITGSGLEEFVLTSITINLNGTQFDFSMDTTGSPEISFNNNVFNGFNYTASSGSLGAPASLSSTGLNVTEPGNVLFFGQWSSVVLTPVPVPAAIWLFGSGVLGLAGVSRRKRSRI